jgi:hypothetical protein
MDHSLLSSAGVELDALEMSQTLPTATKRAAWKKPTTNAEMEGK